jgi:hypothetical protein
MLLNIKKYENCCEREIRGRMVKDKLFVAAGGVLRC